MKLKHLKDIIDTCMRTMDEETEVVLIHFQSGTSQGSDLVAPYTYIEEKESELNPSDISIVNGKIRIG